MNTYVVLCFSLLFTGRKSIKTMPEKRVGILFTIFIRRKGKNAQLQRIVYNSFELSKSVDELSFVPQIFIALQAWVQI